MSKIECQLDLCSSFLSKKAGLKNFNKRQPEYTLGTRGFFSRAADGNSSIASLRRPTPETAQEKPLAPRVTTQIFD